MQAPQASGDRISTQPAGDRPIRNGTLRGVGTGHGGHDAGVCAPPLQLLDQPCLADARFAGQQHQLGIAPLGGTPERRQLGALGGPSHQRWPGRRGRIRDRRRAVDDEQCFIGRSGLGRRIDAQLTLHRGRIRVVRAHGPCSVATGIVQAHQRAVAVLAQRVSAHEALGATDRVGPVGLLLVVAQEPHERVGEAQVRGVHARR